MWPVGESRPTWEHASHDTKKVKKTTDRAISTAQPRTQCLMIRRARLPWLLRHHWHRRVRIHELLHAPDLQLGQHDKIWYDTQRRTWSSFRAIYTVWWSLAEVLVAHIRDAKLPSCDLIWEYPRTVQLWTSWSSIEERKRQQTR